MNMKKNIGAYFLILLLFFIISYWDIPVKGRLLENVYTICGIFFSVGMSLVMTFDFAKIVNSRIYDKMTTALASVRASFIFQFVAASVFFCISQLEYVEEKLQPFIIFGHKFFFKTFLLLGMFYALIFFIYNFYNLTKHKMQLDKIIHDEYLENETHLD